MTDLTAQRPTVSRSWATVPAAIVSQTTNRQNRLTVGSDGPGLGPADQPAIAGQNRLAAGRRRRPAHQDERMRCPGFVVRKGEKKEEKKEKEK